MKKIITAMGNPNLNNKLVQIGEYEIVLKDIQYKEGVIEVLENDRSIDELILDTSIPGDMLLQDFINLVLKIKGNLEITIFLNQEDPDIVNFLNSKGIFKIYETKKYSVSEFIKNLEKTKLDMCEKEVLEDINELKTIILNNNDKERFSKQNQNESKIVMITGASGVRKKCSFFYIIKTY